MNQLLKACSDALTQIEVIVQATIDAQPTTFENIYLKAKVGNHVRHVVDHFLALTKGISDFQVDYNQRSRGSRSETDANAALQAISEIKQSIATLPSISQSITVIAEIDCHQRVSHTFTSTFDRELLYLINHTIHHSAYMKLMLQPYTIRLPDELGIAPSTATFLREGN